MTKKQSRRSAKIKRGISLPNITQTALACLSLLMLSLVIRNSDIAIKYMKEGLSLCADVLIPSLFPFMAVSDIIVKCGGMSPLSSILNRPMRALFGVSGDGGCAVLLGFVCGFPIGARSAVSLYEKGRISKDELRRLLAFSNVPSSAFIINAVGISLFGSRAFGAALYIVVLIAALATGILQNLILRAKNKKREPALSEKTYNPKKEKSSLSVSALTDSVSSSALSMLKVCAFVVFFNAIVGTLSAAADALSLSADIRALLFGFFELTSGISKAALLSPKTAAVLSALFAGWSGLSVHLQIISLCPEEDISPKGYLVSKLFQGVLCAALMWLYISVAPPSIYPSSDGISAYSPDTVANHLALPILALFVCAAAVGIVRKAKGNR